MVNSGTVSFPTIICREYSKNALGFLFSYYYTKLKVMCHFGTLVKICMCYLRLLCAMARDLARKNVAWYPSPALQSQIAHMITVLQ